MTETKTRNIYEETKPPQEYLDKHGLEWVGFSVPQLGDIVPIYEGYHLPNYQCGPLKISNQDFSDFELRHILRKREPRVTYRPWTFEGRQHQLTMAILYQSHQYRAELLPEGVKLWNSITSISPAWLLDYQQFLDTCTQLDGSACGDKVEV